MADPIKIRQAIIDWFSMDDIRGLCADLKIDFENIAGETKGRKALELVAYMQRRNALDALAQAVMTKATGRIQ